jgi:hypothetical protein
MSQVRAGGAPLELVAEADVAFRLTVSALMHKWLAEGEKAGGIVDPDIMFRAIIVGGTKGLVELAADWGVIGMTPDEIGAGFERTAAAAALLHLNGRPVGWAMDLAEKDVDDETP